MTTPSIPPPSTSTIQTQEELVNIEPMSIDTSLENDLSNSPFAKMFRGGATQAELKKFIEQYMQMMITEFKRSTERWKKAQKQLRNAIEGRRLDSD